MNVGELIEKLKECDPDMPVAYPDNYGPTLAELEVESVTVENVEIIPSGSWRFINVRGVLLR